MGRGKAFQCEITVSPAVKEKLSRKHDIEIWEIEEVIYDDYISGLLFSLRTDICRKIPSNVG